jgi:hypothetical protein
VASTPVPPCRPTPQLNSTCIALQSEDDSLTIIVVLWDWYEATASICLRSKSHSMLFARTSSEPTSHRKPSTINWKRRVFLLQLKASRMPSRSYLVPAKSRENVTRLVLTTKLKAFSILEGHHIWMMKALQFLRLCINEVGPFSNRNNAIFQVVIC